MQNCLAILENCLIDFNELKHKLTVRLSNLRARNLPKRNENKDLLANTYRGYNNNTPVQQRNKFDQLRLNKHTLIHLHSNKKKLTILLSLSSTTTM